MKHFAPDKKTAFQRDENAAVVVAGDVFDQSLCQSAFQGGDHFEITWSAGIMFDFELTASVCGGVLVEFTIFLPEFDFDKFNGFVMTIGYSAADDLLTEGPDRTDETRQKNCRKNEE